MAARNEPLASTAALSSQAQSTEQVIEVALSSLLTSKRATRRSSASAERTPVPVPAVKLPSATAVDSVVALRPRSRFFPPRTERETSLKAKWEKRALGAPTKHTAVPTTKVEPPLVDTPVKPVVAVPPQRSPTNERASVPERMGELPSTTVAEPVVASVRDLSEADVGEAQVPAVTDQPIESPAQGCKIRRRWRRGGRANREKQIRYHLAQAYQKAQYQQSRY